MSNIAEWVPSSVSWDVVKAAQTADGIDSLAELLSFEYDLELSRTQLRQLVGYAKSQQELDQLADAPSAPSILTSKIDKALDSEIDRILTENVLLRQIAQAQDDKRFQLDETGEVISPSAARARLETNTQTLLSIKKVSNDQVKAEAGHGNTGVNLTVDLGGMVSSAVKNIKANEIDSGREIVQ